MDDISNILDDVLEKSMEKVEKWLSDNKMTLVELYNNGYRIWRYTKMEKMEDGYKMTVQPRLERVDIYLDGFTR